VRIACQEALAHATVPGIAIERVVAVNDTNSEEAVAATEPEGAGTTKPPAPKARKLAERTWWLPWLLGVAVLVVAVLVITGAFSGDDGSAAEQQMQSKKAELPTSTHTVVYEVNGAGTAPEIRYVVDGAATAEKVEKVALPWRKELRITVGPGVGIAQLLAANSEADQISCSVSVDGQVVNQGVSPGANSTVACSAVIRPTAK
jgi:Mycobacterium membrane protein